MKILTLRICNKWFQKILDWKLTYELKEIKPYWISRLFEKDGNLKNYDKISVKNGYSSISPEVVIEFDGVDEVIEEWKKYFKVKLWNILEVNNYLED